MIQASNDTEQWRKMTEEEFILISNAINITFLN
jgi:hypothetical protein